jgi:hypothetical protein
MNRQRSVGASDNAATRANPRAAISPPANASHRNSASWRSSAPRTSNPPVSQATSAHRVASWNRRGASSNVVLRSSVSSRSYRPASFAPTSRTGTAAAAAHVSCTERRDSITVSRNAATVATTSPTSNRRLNSASRLRLAAGPRSAPAPPMPSRPRLERPREADARPALPASDTPGSESDAAPQTTPASAPLPVSTLIAPSASLPATNGPVRGANDPTAHIPRDPFSARIINIRGT